MSAICTREVKALQASDGMGGLGASLARRDRLLRQALAAFLALYHDLNVKHAGTIAEVERRGSSSD